MVQPCISKTSYVLENSLENNCELEDGKVNILRKDFVSCN